MSKQYFKFTTKKNLIFDLIKVILAAVCVLLFLYLMDDVWTKYRSKRTSTSIQFISVDKSTRQIPLLTVCPLPGKIKGDLEKQSFFLS